LTIIVVAGTGTDVGKTYVAAALLRVLRDRGHHVEARKPAQSFAAGDTETDAHVLAVATGVQPNDVCPPHRWLPIPMAPPMAADALGLPPFTIAELAREVSAGTTSATPLFVETAGGVRSPIADDGDCADLIAALEPALVILVADAGLGTINAVRLSVAALGERRAVIYLNRYDGAADLHARNADWLRTRESLDVVTDVEALADLVEPLFD
jgi:dethiobiotin synthetase